LKISPYLFFSLTLLNYIIIPIANIVFILIIFFAAPGFDIKKEYIESWVIFFLIVSFSRILEFFLVIKKSVLFDARNYMAARKKLEMEKGELDEVLI